MLRRLVGFLEFFQVQTLIFEKSSEPTIHLVIQGFEKMKSHCLLDEGDPAWLVATKKYVTAALKSKFALRAEMIVGGVDGELRKLPFQAVGALLDPRQKSQDRFLKYLGLGEAEYREALNTLKGIHRMCFNNRNMYKRRALEAEVGSIPEAAPLEVSEGDSKSPFGIPQKKKRDVRQ